MKPFEIIILLIIVFGLGYALYIVFRDPTSMLKEFLRALKADGSLRLLIALFPLWGPVWVIDKIFKLNIYIKDLEEASKPQNIVFSDFDKYIQIRTNDINQVSNNLLTFLQQTELSQNHEGQIVKIGIHLDRIIIKIYNGINFNSFNSLIQYLTNSTQKNKIYDVKGILLNRMNRNASYFVFPTTFFTSYLIGKTYKNKKIYMDINPDKLVNETIYYNSNIDYFKNFDFDSFESLTSKLEFKEIKLQADGTLSSTER